MREYKVGDHVLVKLSGHRLAEPKVKAIVDNRNGPLFQASFGNKTALIYLWQVVEESR